MTSVTDAPGNPLPFDRSRSGSTIVGRAIRWLRANLFASIPSSIMTLLLLFVLVKAAASLVQWGLLHAVWTVPGSDTNACRAARGIGACWAVIPEKLRFILFGTYPFNQQWRPGLAILGFLALFLVSSRRTFWRKELALIWVTLAGMALVTYLLRASFLLLPPHVETPPLLRRALRYVPAAVLTAIWAPELLLAGGEIAISLGNERLLAGAVAIAVAWRWRLTFATILAGLAALHLFHWLI